MFGRVKEKWGSDYSVILHNDENEVLVSYQRINVLPKTNELELEMESKLILNKDFCIWMLDVES